MNDSITESIPLLPPSLTEVETIIGYNFKNKALLEEAFTHHSYKDADFQSYERLEYLGDSVLNILFAKEHFFSYLKMKSGELTRLRSANVDTESLARVAFKHGLHQFIKHEDPSLKERVEEFMDGIKEYPLHSHGLINSPKVLADIVESVIGAVYVDTGTSIEETWEVVKKMFEPFMTPEKLSVNPMTKLNELCQKLGIDLEYRNLWAETGDFEVYKDNELIGKGNHKKKKMTAKNKAADDAYQNLVKIMGKSGSTCLDQL